MKEKTYSGTVVQKEFGKGSKSQHKAIMLVTDDDGELKLRRLGANPFTDNILESLIGSKIQCTGKIDGTTMFVDSWKETDESS